MGDFEILDEIGRGGMGIVWRARQLSLNRIVALKTVRDERTGDPAQRMRLHAEAEAAATLHHPNIVPVFEVGEVDNRSYFAMQLVEGGTLADHLAEGLWPAGHCPAHGPSRFLRGRLRRSACCPRGAALVAKLARAVHYAHQHGVLHRDLKPGNILLDEEGEPHIADFGLARWLDRSLEGGAAWAGEILGTPAYMAPEQAAGRAPITTAADVYGLGAILYHVLTGRPPFLAETRAAVLRLAVEGAPVPPRHLRPDIDQDLEAICLKCLARDPLERYASAASLADDLDRWSRGETVRARRASPGQQVVRWARRRPAVAALTLLTTLATVGGFGGIAWQWRRAERETRRVRETAAREAQALLRNEDARDTLLAQARVLRTSRMPGQRVKALAALAAAARLRPSLELRNEALAALALPDLEPVGPPASFPTPMVAIALDPNLRRGVGIGREGEFQIRELDTGRLVLSNLVPNLPSGGLTFSPDGRWLAAHGSREGRCWNVETLETSRRWLTRVGNRRQANLAFAPDGRRLATGDGNESIQIADLQTGVLEAEVRAGAIVEAFAFSPDGRHLAILGGRALQIRRVRDGGLESRFILPPGNWVEWPEDGARLFVASKDGWVRVVEPETGRVRLLAEIDSREVPPMVAQPLGDLLVLAAPGRAGGQLWEISTGRPLLALPEKALRFGRDGRLLGGLRGTVAMVSWRVVESEGVHVLPGPRPGLRDLDLSADGRWLAAASEDGVHLWKLATGSEVDFVPLAGARTVRFAQDRAGLLVEFDDGFRSLPLLTKERRFYRETGLGEPQASLAAGSPGEATPPSSSSPREAARPSPPPSGQGEARSGRRLRLSDPRTGETLAELAAPDDASIEHAALTRDGQRILARGEEGRIFVWDLTRLRRALAEIHLDWADTAPDLPRVELVGTAIPAELAPTSVARHLLQSSLRPGTGGLAPREAEATPDQLDLTPHYNALLHENWMGGRPEVDDSFGSLPRGLQRLGGVRFDIRGLVQLAGTADDPAREHFPVAVRDIQVESACSHLHFLMAGRWALARFEGRTAAHVVLHYAEGGSTTNAITTGIELGDAWHWPGQTADALRAEVVWRGTNETSAGFGASLRLFRWTLENPHPDRRISSLDLVSTLSPVAPFFVAITVESRSIREGSPDR